MKKYSIIFVLSLIIIGQIYPANISIKSLKAYIGRKETSFPLVLPADKNANHLTIEFDIQSTFEPDLSIVFRFCDKNWKPYQNIFLSNQGQNIKSPLQYSTLPNTVTEAKYHYRGSFPDENGYVSFPFSGKWMFFITDAYDTSKVYSSGKFFVVYDTVKMITSLRNEQLEDHVYFPADLAKIFNITTDFNLPQEFYPEFVDRVEIVDNRKIDYPIIVDRTFNTNSKQFYWNGAREFTFTARDILPGNEYRELDMMNVNRYNSRDVRAQFDGIEYSRFFHQGARDLNGSSILMNPYNTFATYLNVTFSIRPPNDYNGEIFLTGAFNNWKLSPDYELQNNDGLYSIEVPLKRGIYDYQYVTGNLENNKISNANWVYLEGNSWQTSNQYFVFLYYKDQNYGGYDRIIGYQKIVSR